METTLSMLSSMPCFILTSGQARRTASTGQGHRQWNKGFRLSLKVKSMIVSRLESIICTSRKFCENWSSTAASTVLLMGDCSHLLNRLRTMVHQYTWFQFPSLTPTTWCIYHKIYALPRDNSSLYYNCSIERCLKCSFATAIPVQACRKPNVKTYSNGTRVILQKIQSILSTRCTLPIHLALRLSEQYCPPKVVGLRPNVRSNSSVRGVPWILAGVTEWSIKISAVRDGTAAACWWIL